ncbi:related to DNA-dependent ATPase MGS1 [Hanseniaspora guilliermondii]|uniref:Related to DNA-dependent ATPase MGS1 n=1 Tax=Hanseniaspora guilliermondii TaxID=56406 RepID=A0A1L0AZM1_9ASCO|nr:related to DNA-dependent ATPase MGS1 [Hanseniaspora guilliermondii]
MSEEDNIISCPSCSKKIPMTKVNSHLDTCLSGTQNTLKTALSGRVKKPFGLSRRAMSTVIPSTKTAKTNAFTRSMTLDGMSNVKLQSQNTIEHVEEIKDEILLSDNENGNIDETPKKSEYETKFDDPEYLEKIKDLPLYEKLKPQCLKTYIGQDHLLNKKTGILYKHLSSTPSTIPNMILFGPPSIGKTSLITVLLNELNTRSTCKWKIYSFSGVSLSIPDLKKTIEQTVKSYQNWRIKSIIFIDEIHRLNKLQQDSLLKICELGHARLVGCTTENPSFKINDSVLSRLNVFVLNEYTREERWRMFELIKKVQTHYLPRITFQSEDQEREIFDTVIGISRDNRRFISLYENLYLYCLDGNKDSHSYITVDKMKEMTKSNAFKNVMYYNTDTHYELISAFHKAVRGSDTNAALYYMFKMLKHGCDPLYICRRMIRIASEDIGILNNQALIFANSTYDSCMKLGMPESDVILAHCCVMLCESPKSVKVYRAMNKIKTALDENSIYRDGDVPYHLRNAPTKLMERLGYKKDYKYNPDYKDGVIPEGQDYFPDSFYNENLDNTDKTYLNEMKHVYDNEKHLG